MLRNKWRISKSENLRRRSQRLKSLHTWQLVVPSDLLTIPKRGGPCNKGEKGRQLTSIISSHHDSLEENKREKRRATVRGRSDTLEAGPSSLPSSPSMEWRTSTPPSSGLQRWRSLTRRNGMSSWSSGSNWCRPTLTWRQLLMEWTARCLFQPDLRSFRSWTLCCLRAHESQVRASAGTISLNPPCRGVVSSCLGGSQSGSDISKLSTSAGSLSWTSPTINDQLHEVSSFQTSLLVGSKDKMGWKKVCRTN